MIEWKENAYGIFNDGQKFNISTPSMHTTFFDTPDELLEYRIGDDRLRDIITQVKVNDRVL